MDLFREMEGQGHEEVCFFSEPRFGLKGIIAIHDSTLGPSLGGCRMWPYKSIDEALIDVLRLSRGMTYKAAVARLALGGGKAVIIGDPKKDKSQNLWRAFGRFVEGLGGRYITAEDVGTSVEDMEAVHLETRHVTGIAQDHGGGGDPSRLTAWGTFLGIKSAVKSRLRRESLEGLRIAVQGLGHVGTLLSRHLAGDGARLFVTDIDPEPVQRAVDELGAIRISPEAIYDQDVDVFAPCALGAVINDETIPRLRCSIVAGAANNPLLDYARHGEELMRRGILFAPDYVINAGGLINVFEEIQGYDGERANQKANLIYGTLQEIFQLSEREGIPPMVASDRIAEALLEAAKRQKTDPLRNIYLPPSS